MTQTDDQALVRAVQQGQRYAIASLIGQLTPVIQARAAGALRKTAAVHGRDPRQEVADLTQEVFVALLKDDARMLTSWKPGGLSLRNFVGLIAERQVISILRSKRRAPYTEQPSSDHDEILMSLRPAEGPERALATREALEHLLMQLREALSPGALDIFYRLFVHEQSIETICTETGSTPSAVYAHRHRIKEIATRIWTHLDPQAADHAAADVSRARSAG